MEINLSTLTFIAVAGLYAVGAVANVVRGDYPMAFMQALSVIGNLTMCFVSGKQGIREVTSKPDPSLLTFVAVAALYAIGGIANILKGDYPLAFMQTLSVMGNLTMCFVKGK